MHSLLFNKEVNIKTYLITIIATIYYRLNDLKKFFFFLLSDNAYHLLLVN